MKEKQNVISFLDFNNSKIVIMLINGTDSQFAKIEEFEFERKNAKSNMVLNVLINVLDSFVSENLCKQANYYCVLPKDYSSAEFVKVPNLNLKNARTFIKPELERLGIKASEYFAQDSIVLRNKKFTMFKVNIFKKSLISKIYETHKKLGLNLKGVGEELSSSFSAICGLVKQKHSPNLIIDIQDERSLIYYSNKGKMIFSYAMPYGKKQMQQKETIGNLQSSADACFEVYFNDQSLGNSFAGVQLDIEGGSREKKKVLEKHSKVWKAIQKESGIVIEIEPLIKIVNLIKECVENNNLPMFNEIYINANEEMYEAFVEEVLKDNAEITIKNIGEDIENFELKDYLHLFGIVWGFKMQPENVIDVKIVKTSKWKGNKNIKQSTLK